jgi:hypothetical protein
VVTLKFIAQITRKASNDNEAFVSFEFADGTKKAQLLKDAINNGNGTYTFECKIPANKMIPEDVALKSDIPEAIPVPATAEVGQVVAVKAVDENGKPTEWEAVDMNAGSGLTDFLIYFDEAVDGSKTWHANMTGTQFVSLLNNKTLGNLIVRRYALYEGQYVLYEINDQHTYFASTDTNMVQFIFRNYQDGEFYIQLNADGTLQEWSPPD